MAHRLSLSTGRLWALAAAVLALHAVVGEHLADTVRAWSDDASSIDRLSVAYVRQMDVAAPVPLARPAPMALPAPPRGPAAPHAVPENEPRSPEAAASAPEAEALPEPVAAPGSTTAVVPAVTAAERDPPSDPADPAVPNASSLRAGMTPAPGPDPTAGPALQARAGPPQGPSTASGPVPTAAISPVPTPDAAPAVAVSGAASAAPPFAWPASTRLSYRLSGQYRGEVHGRAQVEWVLAAPRYQVHLDVSVGLAAAPLFSRRMTSDGRLTAAGLRPERYDERSKMAFRDPRTLRLTLDDEGVLLADGRRWTRPPRAASDLAIPGPVHDVAATASAAHSDPMASTAVQDSASQFVQLSYLFTLNPGLLAPGQTFGFPLALPRRVEPWVYEVVGTQTQHTPFGALDTFHVRPRPGTPRGNDLLAEAWFAPQLAYLPVRIRIEQDAEVHIDLVLDRRPELAAAPR